MGGLSTVGRKIILGDLLKHSQVIGVADAYLLAARQHNVDIAEQLVCLIETLFLGNGLIFKAVEPYVLAVHGIVAGLQSVQPLAQAAQGSVQMWAESQILQCISVFCQNHNSFLRSVSNDHPLTAPMVMP